MDNFKKGMTIKNFSFHNAMMKLDINEINNYPTDKIVNFDGLTVIDVWKFMDYQANQPPILENINAKMRGKIQWPKPEQNAEIRKWINEHIKTIDALPYKKTDEIKKKAMDSAFPPYLCNDPIQAFIDMMSGDTDEDK